MLHFPLRQFFMVLIDRFDACEEEEIGGGMFGKSFKIVPHGGILQNVVAVNLTVIEDGIQTQSGFLREQSSFACFRAMQGVRAQGERAIRIPGKIDEGGDDHESGEHPLWKKFLLACRENLQEAERQRGIERGCGEEVLVLEIVSNRNCEHCEEECRGEDHHFGENPSLRFVPPKEQESHESYDDEETWERNEALDRRREEVENENAKVREEDDPKEK